MRQHSLAPRFKTLIASTAYTTTVTSSAFALPGLADTYHLILNCTAATGTSPTVDAVLQSSVDGGTTYVNLPLRATQITAAGVRHLVFKLGLGGNEVALENTAADTGGTLAKNCIFDPNFMKIKFTVGGTNPSVTIVVYGASLAAGSNWS
jgi:hypothetical protein